MSRKDKRNAREEVGANGLTRREMNADLTARSVEFGPYDPIDSVAALHAAVK